MADGSDESQSVQVTGKYVGPHKGLLEIRVYDQEAGGYLIIAVDRLQIVATALGKTDGKVREHIASALRFLGVGTGNDDADDAEWRSAAARKAAATRAAQKVS